MKNQNLLNLFRSRFIIIVLFLLFYSNYTSFAGNPLIPDIGMSDPHIRVFNDTIYLFCGNDEHPDDRIWVMRDWRVFSTTDLINWKQETVISPENNYMGKNTSDCWAGDAANRNGKYYFYFSDQKRGIGVMEAETPGGDYVDALGKPLVAPMHDPTILIDDDANKTPYMVYGDKEFGGFHVAKMNDDMISLSENPKPIIINGDEWENAPFWMDKNYIFKKNGTYYLSWGRDYAISENIYGPYTCVGSVGHGHELNSYAHGSFFNWKGQFYHTWCYYIRPGYKYRETIISYCHFGKDGELITDTRFLDKHFKNGVGQYNSDWDKIEAEWYYEQSGSLMKSQIDSNNFAVTNISNEDWIMFSNVKVSSNINSITLGIQNKIKKGKVEVRSCSLDGKLLSTIEFSSNGTVHTSKIKELPAGNHDLYFTFKDLPDSSIEFDWFKLSGS